MPWPSQEHRRRSHCHKWYLLFDCAINTFTYSHFITNSSKIQSTYTFGRNHKSLIFVSFFVCLFVFSFSFILYKFFDRRTQNLVEHNHEEDIGRVEAAQQAGCLIYRSISSIGAKMEKFSFDCTMIEENKYL